MSLVLSTAFLVIMGCNGDPMAEDCPEEIRPESWVSTQTHQVDAKEECEAFIHSPEFDPKQYITGYDFYAVRCER